MVKNLPANAGNTGETGSILGSGRAPRVGNGNLFQYPCLENSMDRATWWATCHGVAKRQTWLSSREGLFLMWSLCQLVLLCHPWQQENLSSREIHSFNAVCVMAPFLVPPREGGVHSRAGGRVGTSSCQMSPSMRLPLHSREPLCPVVVSHGRVLRDSPRRMMTSGRG